MAVQGELSIAIRDFAGIDLAANARVNNPSAFRMLQNVYHEEAGKLTKRPGSKVFAERVVAGHNELITSHIPTSGNFNPDTYPPIPDPRKVAPRTPRASDTYPPITVPRRVTGLVSLISGGVHTTTAFRTTLFTP